MPHRRQRGSARRPPTRGGSPSSSAHWTRRGAARRRESAGSRQSWPSNPRASVRSRRRQRDGSETVPTRALPPPPPPPLRPSPPLRPPPPLRLRRGEANTPLWRRRSGEAAKRERRSLRHRSGWSRRGIRGSCVYSERMWRNCRSKCRRATPPSTTICRVPSSRRWRNEGRRCSGRQRWSARSRRRPRWSNDYCALRRPLRAPPPPTAAGSDCPNELPPPRQ